MSIRHRDVFPFCTSVTSFTPQPSFECLGISAASNQPVIDIRKTAESMANIGDQLTLEESFRLSKLSAGEYQLVVRVTDLVSGKIVAPTARFAVE